MSFDPREMRDALGRFATGICIITRVTDSGHAIGLTANSFASVSLDPPLVLWSLQGDSEVFSQFSAPGPYAINILGSEHEDHSRRYAVKGDHALAPEHYLGGSSGAPVIHDALASFECELHATHEGGDHLIIVGRVTEMHVAAEGEPLVFYRGGYRQLA